MGTANQKPKESTLTERYKRLSISFANAVDVVLLTDNKGKITEANKSALKLLRQKSTKNLIGQKVTSFILPKDKKRLDAILAMQKGQVMVRNFCCSVSVTLERPILVEASFSSMSDETGENIGYVINAREVSNREENEYALKQALDEKKVLLREIHHRVKNNLQVIHSILNLQTSYIASPTMLPIIEEIQHRIRTMSFIHEILYRSRNLVNIDLNEYINELMRYLYQAYVNKDKDITMVSEIEKVELDLQTATSCGMIFNELISNSLKHAYKDIRKGVIRVAFRNEPGFYILTVQDDGKGFAYDGLSAMPKTFGLRLIRLLSEQLNGNLTINAEKGTTVSIIFPK